MSDNSVRAQEQERQERLLGNGHPTYWRARPATDARFKRVMVVGYSPPSREHVGSVAVLDVSEESSSAVHSIRWPDFFAQYQPRGWTSGH